MLFAKAKYQTFKVLLYNGSEAATFRLIFQENHKNKSNTLLLPYLAALQAAERRYSMYVWSSFKAEYGSTG